MVQFFQLQPEYEKPSGLSQALGGIGRGGLSLMEQLGQIQQQKQLQEQQQRQQSQLAQALFGEDAEKFVGIPMEAQLQIAKQRSAPAPGGISAQAVPEQVRQKIPEILNTNKEASADELAIKFDEAGIPRAFSNSYIETRRRQDEQREGRELKGEEIARKEKFEFHKESKKFDEELTKRSESSQRKIKAIEQQEKLLPTITKGERFISALFSGTKMEDIFKAQSAQEFDSLVLPMIEGQKENFGVRLSDADLKLVLQKIATSTKNPEANKAILNWQKLDSKLDLEKRKIADDIKKENKGLRPIDFEDQIRVKMNEKFGNEIQEKASDIIKLSEDPQLSAKITERVKVEPGTKLSEDKIDLYLKLSNNNPKEAERMALEDGYVF